MKKQLIILIFLVVVLAGVGVISTVFEPREQFTWGRFYNLKYHYTFQYPTIARVGTSNDYGWNDLPDQASIDVSVLGKTTLFEIETEYQEATSTSLKDYAEKVRNRQVNNDNKYCNPQIGELKEIMFAGKPAYSFTLDKCFASAPYGGYTLGNGQFHDYILTQNNFGQKITIHYLIKSTTYPEGVKLAKKIRDSFVYMETVTHRSLPQAWDTKYGEL